MSPAKKAKTGTPKTLTVEFSGICTLVWNAKERSAAVHLVDLGSAGFQRHYTALGLVISEEMAHGVKGPDADAAVSLPGTDRDIGLWNLLSTDVEIIGGTGPLTADDTKVDVLKKPGKNATSLNWLANIGSLAESNKQDPLCPTAAVVKLPAGHITASSAADARKVQFIQDGVPIGPARFCVPRFKAVIPFDEEIGMRLDRRRVLRFTSSISVIVSNTCVCGLGLSSPENHFYGHYEVVRAKRRPRVEPAGPKLMVPMFPEFCFGGFVSI